MRILLSAYACEPEAGSEPGVGWGWATALAAAGHEVRVVTRANNRDAIEAGLAARPQPGLRFEYVDLPDWALAAKRRGGALGLRAYYLAWCAAARRRARAVTAGETIDLCHHATFAQCWTPSPLAGLGPPLLWGPVGGAEPCPAAFWPGLGWSGSAYEATRAVLRGLAPWIPAWRRTARGAALVAAATPETAGWIRRHAGRAVLQAPQIGLEQPVLDRLAAFTRPEPSRCPEGWRLVMLGDLLPHKGGHLAVAALAALPGGWHLDVVGDGPQRRRLVSLARRLGLQARISFHGRLPRPAALEHLRRAHLLLYPALHDSAGLAVAEALAAGVPVVCLQRGGPPHLVGDGGVAVPSADPHQAVRGLAAAVSRLMAEPARWPALSDAARRRGASLGWADTVRRVYGRLDGVPTPDTPAATP